MSVKERLFKRLLGWGGVERRGKGSHKVVNINQMNLSIPHGILKEGLLRRLIELSGYTVEDFLRSL